MTTRARLLGRRLFGAAVVATALASACADKKGALILAINTDMKAPKDVNAVSVTVSTNGAIKHSFIGRVTPDGEVLLPATLAIVQPDDANASIRIRVMAFQERKPRVLRDVRTTIPRDGRTGLLRIPLNFINDGMLAGAPLPDGVLPPLNGGGGGIPAGDGNGGGGGAGGDGNGGGGGGGGGGAADFDFFGSFQPPCPDIQNQTIIDGDCKDNAIDPDALPDYDDTLVFGAGKDGSDTNGCFETARCFGSAMPVQGGGADVVPPRDGDGGAAGTDGGVGTKTVTPQGISIDTTACVINGAGDPSQLNLAIVTPDTGECVKDGECYIPIDQGPAGWHVDNGRVQLPTVVCKLLGKGLRLVATSGTCKAKTEAQPICRPAPQKQEPQRPLLCLTSCGACITQHCAATDIGACFGPDWAAGNVSGVCKSFYDCACGCPDINHCQQCDMKSFGSCEECLVQHIETCVNASCKDVCNSGNGSGADDAGVPDATMNGNGASVSLTFTPGNPPAMPHPGEVFGTNVGGFSMPVPGDDAVLASNGSLGVKFEYCHGSLAPGKRLSAFSFPGCTNGNPSFVINDPSGAVWKAVEGTVEVKSVSPLGLAFQNLIMMSAAQGTGSFTVNGSGQWFGVNAGP